MSAAPGRWKRTTPLTQEQRLAQFHQRFHASIGDHAISEEELLRRQARGLPVRERIVRRAFSIPRHRALVVIDSRRKQ